MKTRLIPILYTLTAKHFATKARATDVAITDGLGHVGRAIAPALVLGVAGFAGGLAVMAISGLIVIALVPFTLSMTGSSLE